MDPLDNPFAPGAGNPPPELAGRADILTMAETSIGRSLRDKPAKSILMLGLRGIGKTVLLNRIDEFAEEAGCKTAIFEAEPDQSLANLIAKQLLRILHELDRVKKAGNDLKGVFAMLREFASAFKVTYGDFEFGLTKAHVTGDLTQDLSDLFLAVGKAAKARDTSVVILIDEVQYLSENDLSALIMALHKISQRRLPFLVFGAGLPQLAKLAGDSKSYTERLFEYPKIDRLDKDSARNALVLPIEREGAKIDEEAVELILNETGCYPFFIQVWGSFVWEIAKESPIRLSDAQEANRRSMDGLDQGFFKVRFDRLTEREQEYSRAIAELGPEPAGSTAVAKLLGINVKRAAPIRNGVIKKGMAYSPTRGKIAFTVPKFDDYLKRVMTDFQFKKK